MITEGLLIEREKRKCSLEETRVVGGITHSEVKLLNTGTSLKNLFFGPLGNKPVNN